MDKRHFLDKRRARVLAGFIGVLALTGMAMTWHYQQRTDAAGRAVATAPKNEPAPALNPRYLECREQRSADIAKMLSDGVIDQAKHDEFLSRALQNCAGMFPPQG